MRFPTPFAISAALAVSLLAGASATAASAQSGSWKAHMGAGTDNRARDISKSDGEAMVWGRALWHSEGGAIYAGPAFETLNMGGSELGYGVMIGARSSFAGFDFDLQSSYKTLLDADAGFDDGTFEFKADAMRAIGPVKTRLRAEYSPDGLGGTEEWSWVSAQVAYPLSRSLTASVEVGYRDQENNIDYTGYNAGVTYAVTPKMGLDVRWHGTDANIPGEQHNDRFVASVTYGF